MDELYIFAMENAQRFNKNVKRMRRLRGYTLRKFSAVCGVSTTQLCAYEKGKATPTLLTALALCKALDANIGDMLLKEVTKDGFKNLEDNTAHS